MKNIVKSILLLGLSVMVAGFTNAQCDKNGSTGRCSDACSVWPSWSEGERIVVGLRGENFNPREPAPPGSTTFSILDQKSAPAELRSFEITRESVLRHPRLNNVSTKEITGYQLGSVLSGRSNPSHIFLGSKLRLVQKLPPHSTLQVSDHPFPSSLWAGETDTSKVGFFVAAVTFADGTSWKANLKALTRY